MFSVDDFTFDDDEDELFASVLDQEESEGSRPNVLQAEYDRSDQGSDNGQQNFPGFDREVGTNWLYPVNYPIRNYQLAIVERALFGNTLVCLPTGLGKTFIAAVVMFNLYRYYPKGKVVFMAPTKPLVAQQIEACFKVMGIPQEDMLEMTCTGIQGQPKNRRQSWKSKRVFFLTPQLFVNDLQSGNCPAADVKCLVVDEAHKATGNHAYVQAVRLMSEHHLGFRVLALSATPGFSLDTVQEVITNLLIARVEIRADDSADLQAYVNKRTVDVIVVAPGDVLLEFKKLYLDILRGYLQRLERHGVISQRNPETLTKFLLIKQRDFFRAEPHFQTLQAQARGAIEGDFALCMTLYHGFELLNKQGLVSCYHFLRGIDEKNQFRIQNELARNATYQQLIGRLREQAGTDRPGTSSEGSEPSAAGGGNESAGAFSHPKMDKLVEVVVAHFEAWEQRRAAGSQSVVNRDATSVMIFAEYRDTVDQIKQALDKRRPLVRPLSFVGQSRGTGAAAKGGLTQKLQRQALDTFRRGNFNTLVSTCVAEEGLDIGEVDLIVCYEAHSSAVRLVQRMGRTGRKRDGRVVMLLTKGSEETVYKRSLTNKNSLHRAVSAKLADYQLYPLNPRMIPHDLNPVCLQVNVTELAFTRKAMTDRQRSANQKSPFLSEFELAEFRRRYELPGDAAAIRQPPVSTPMLSLGGRPDTTSDADHLSLIDWLPWQGSLQRTFLVSHTDTTRMLVSCLNSSSVAFPDYVADPVKSPVIPNKPKRRQTTRVAPSTTGCPSIRNYFSPTKRLPDNAVAGPSTAPDYQPPPTLAKCPAIQKKPSPAKRPPPVKKTTGLLAKRCHVDTVTISTVDRFFRKQDRPDFFSLPDGCLDTRPVDISTSDIFQRPSNPLPAFRPPPDFTDVDLESFLGWSPKVSSQRTPQSPCQVNFKIVLSDDSDAIAASEDEQDDSVTVVDAPQKEDPLLIQLDSHSSRSTIDSDETYCGSDLERVSPVARQPVNTSNGTAIDWSPARTKWNGRISGIVALSTSNTISKDGPGSLSLSGTKGVPARNKLCLASLSPTACRTPVGSARPRAGGGAEFELANAAQVPSGRTPATLSTRTRSNVKMTPQREVDDSMLTMTDIMELASDNDDMASPQSPPKIDSMTRCLPGTNLALKTNLTSVSSSKVTMLSTADDDEDILRIFGGDDDEMDTFDDCDDIPAPAQVQPSEKKRVKDNVRPLVSMKLISSSSSGSDSDGGIIYPSPMSTVRSSRVMNLYQNRRSLALPGAVNTNYTANPGVSMTAGSVQSESTNRTISARSPISIPPISARVGNASATTSITLGSTVSARSNPTTSRAASWTSVGTPFAAASPGAKFAAVSVAAAASNRMEAPVSEAPSKMRTSVTATSSQMRTSVATTSSQMRTSLTATSPRMGTSNAARSSTVTTSPRDRTQLSSTRTSGLPTTPRATTGVARTFGGGGGGIVDVDYIKWTPSYRAARYGSSSDAVAAPSRMSTPRADVAIRMGDSPPVTPVRRPLDRRVGGAEDNSDDDFVDPVTVRRRPDVRRRVRSRQRTPVVAATSPVASPVTSPVTSPITSPSIVRRPTKRRNMIANRPSRKTFVLSQADMSGVGHSSSDPDSDGDPTLNAYDPSFIDDRVASTQLDNVNEGDMTRYLRSVRSPPVRPGAFKLIPRSARPLSSQESEVNVYSQQPQASQLSESYEQDSFCVDNDEVEFADSSDDTARSGSSCSPDVRRTVTSARVAPNRKRIIRKFSSSDSDT